MKAEITKPGAQAFRQRWEAVTGAELEELRRTPVATKFRQLAALMASVPKLGWKEALASEEAEVRDRWNRLKRTCGA